jgi:hypothetical protein
MVFLNRYSLCLKNVAAAASAPDETDGMTPSRRIFMVDAADSETHAHAGIRFLWGEPQGYDEAAAQLMPHAWQAGAQTTVGLMTRLCLLRKKRRMRRIGTAASWPIHSVSNEDFARNFCQPRRARSTLAFGSSIKNSREVPLEKQ